MNIFFSRKYRYTANRPIATVRQDFTKVTGNKWNDTTGNITGTMNGSDSFRFTHKWTPGYIKGIFGTDLATIKGTLKNEGQKTVIETTLYPNAGLVFFIYCMAALLFCELFNIQVILKGPKSFLLFFFPFFGLILYGVILFFTNGLRNTFENVFRLQRD